MTAGQSFVKAIKPLGCVLFLILFAVFMVFCFTSKAPLGDKYTCPQTTEYYSEHLDEFEQELKTNLLPLVDGIEDCRRSGDKISIVFTFSLGLANEIFLVMIPSSQAMSSVILITDKISRTCLAERPPPPSSLPDFSFSPVNRSIIRPVIPPTGSSPSRGRI